MVLTSCEKEEITRNQSSSEENNVNSEEFVNKAQNLRVWYDNGKVDGTVDVDYGCKSSGGNCYATVDVTYSIAQELNDVIDDVNAGNEDEIRNSFLNSKHLLIKVLGPKTFENVINGFYIPSTRGDLTIDESVYFVFEVKNEVVEVIPVKIK